jgi:hypothetical protein
MQISSIEQLKNAPISKESVISNAELATVLQILIGKPFHLSGAPRTDGSNLRKLISGLFVGKDIAVAEEGQYEIVPEKKKGVPKMLLLLLDSYIVTSGDSYNLQVWNRIPNSDNVLVQYPNGETIACRDIRYVFVKVDVTHQIIESVIIMTDEDIEANFGVFGVPTIKHQLIVADTKRKDIIEGRLVIQSKDSSRMQRLCKTEYVAPTKALSEIDVNDLLSISILKERLQSLKGQTLAAADTKTRGQLLERTAANLIGYSPTDSLVGGYPDIPNQLLEIKVQDSPTIDLGAHSPMLGEIIVKGNRITTKDVRYLIALTNSENGVIEDIILTAGRELGKYFTYVPTKSYKCQRSIPMDFFTQNKGKAVCNPEYTKAD